ncbi:MAG: RNA polymerase sigma-70 factor [Cyclobacteriaceae bacterium]
MNTEIKIWISKVAEEDDSRSFRLLFNNYYDRLLKIAQYFVKSDVLSEEIVVDVFVSTWKNRHKLLEIEKLDHFLFSAVKRKSIDYLRKLKREKTIPIDNSYENTFKSESNPESEVLYKEFESVVNAAILMLPPKRQLIYRMIKEDGLKYREVSELLEVSEKTVEFHIGQALKDLRGQLHKYLSSKEIKNHLNKLASTIIVIFSSFLIV